MFKFSDILGKLEEAGADSDARDFAASNPTGGGFFIIE